MGSPCRLDHPFELCWVTRMVAKAAAGVVARAVTSGGRGGEAIRAVSWDSGRGNGQDRGRDGGSGGGRRGGWG